MRNKVIDQTTNLQGAKVLFVLAQNDVGGHSVFVANLAREFELMGMKAVVYVPTFTHYGYLRIVRMKGRFNFRLLVRYTLGQIRKLVKLGVRYVGVRLVNPNVEYHRYFAVPKRKVLMDYNFIFTGGYWQLDELINLGIPTERIIHTIHHPHTNNRDNLQEVFTSSKVFLVSSSNVTTSRLRNLGVTVDSTIPLGVDTKLFRKEKSSKTSISAEKKVGFFFYNHPRKSPELVIEIVSRLREIKPKWKIFIFGNGFPNADAHIRVLEGVSMEEYARYMRELDLFIYCSQEEGFGLPPLEAAASGVQTLASAVGAIPEYAPDFETIHVVPLKFQSRDWVDLIERSVQVVHQPQLISAKWSWRRVAMDYKHVMTTRIYTSRKGNSSVSRP
jgi:glycosyltransferase involved in cell wall biosynthesis